MSVPARRWIAPRGLVWLTASHVWAVFGLALSSMLLGVATIWAGLAAARSGPARAEWRRIWRTARGLLLPAATYTLFYGASAATSVVPGSGGEFGSAVFTLLGLPLLLLCLQGESAVRWMRDCTVVAIGLFALWGLAQYLFTEAGPVWNRIPGPFSHYMTFSGVLLMGVVLLLPSLVMGQSRRPLHWLLLAVIVVTMGLTLTRHVWIATLAAGTIVVWMAARRWTPAWVTALLVAALAVSACAPEHWGRVRSIVDLEDASNYDRLCMVWSGTRMVADRPFFGLGPGSVEEMYPIYRHPSAPRPDAKHLHNTFLQMAAERGLLELAAYLWLMLAAARAGFVGFREERRRGGASAELHFTAFLAVVVLNLAGLFEANWRDTEVCRLMLFLLAIPWCLRLGGGEARAAREA